MFFSISIALDQRTLWGLLACLLFLVPLIAVRRKLPMYRVLRNGYSWYRREYLGETTWFPTYRRYGTQVWVRRWELKRGCYADTGNNVTMHGRHERKLGEHKRPRAEPWPVATGEPASTEPVTGSETPLADSSVAPHPLRVVGAGPGN